MPVYQLARDLQPHNGRKYPKKVANPKLPQKAQKSCKQRGSTATFLARKAQFGPIHQRRQDSYRPIRHGFLSLLFEKSRQKPKSTAGNRCRKSGRSGGRQFRIGRLFEIRIVRTAEFHETPRRTRRARRTAMGSILIPHTFFVLFVSFVVFPVGSRLLPDSHGTWLWLRRDGRSVVVLKLCITN